MARQKEDYPRNMYDYTSPPHSLSVLGAIVWSIITIMILVVVVVVLGPIADWFSNWLMTQNGNPYVPIALSMFSWWYIFIALAGVIAFVLIWKAAIFDVQYGRYG